MFAAPDNTLTVDVLLGIAKGIPLAACAGFLMWWKDKSDKKVAQEVINKADLALAKIDSHLNECEKIPKAVLVNKLENLDAKFEDFLDESREFRDGISKAFERGETKFDQLNATLLQLLIAKNGRGTS